VRACVRVCVCFKIHSKIHDILKYTVKIFVIYMDMNFCYTLLICLCFVIV